MVIYVIKSHNLEARVMKKTKEDAIKWFKEMYPTREILDIYICI